MEQLVKVVGGLAAFCLASYLVDKAVRVIHNPAEYDTDTIEGLWMRRLELEKIHELHNGTAL